MKESETALLTSEYGLAINRSVQQKLAYLLPKIQMEMFLSFAVIYRPCMSFRMILSDLAKYSMPGSIATAELLVSSPPCIWRPFGESPSEYCHTVWYEPSQQSAYRQHSAPQHWVRRLSLKSTVIFSWQWTCFCIVIGTLAVDGWAQLLLLVQ